MDTPERWRPHGPMSAPGNGPLNFDGLPADVGALCRVAQGVLIHSDWLAAYGVRRGAVPDGIARDARRWPVG